MGDEARTKGRLPEWLNGQTLALATVMAAFAAMVQAGFGDLRDDLEARIDRLSTDVQADIRELRTDIRGLDDRLRNVEIRLESMDVRLTRVEEALLAPRRGAVALVPPPAGGDAAGTRDGQGAAASNDALRQVAP